MIKITGELMKYIPYVNINMGTDSVMRFSNGNTLPLVSYPFGMASFCPQTDGSSRWLYSPLRPYMEGIRLTHQPSPWIGDYGTVLFTVQNDVISDTPSGAWSGYRIEDSILRPDYMRVRLLRSDCTLELTPTERGCAMRIEREDDRQAYFSCLPTQGNYTYRLDTERNMVIGTNDAHSQDEAQGFKMYFVIKLIGGIDEDKTRRAKDCIHIALKSKKTEARVAISYISEEMAMLTLEREMGEKSFDEIRSDTESAWESRLKRIEIDAQDERQMRTFYSCMYRCFLFPRKAYEIDRDGQCVHYVPFDGSVRKGVRYADTGFWDTYRTLYPLYTLIAREEYAEMLESFVLDYEECGWLPRWISIGEVGCMPSTLIDAVIAEAASQKIVAPALLERALQGMLHHASTASSKPRYGRNGIEEYLKYGYVPRDLYKESVNLTLDFAYGDWCIAQVARALGKDDIYSEYMERADAYKRLFDKNSGFMRGRDRNGDTSPDFDPISWGGDYTEGSAWQSSFAVPHDIDGLCALYGGKKALISKLDELVSTPPKYRVFGYGGEIHEMTEMASADLGQCAISNQPSFHIPYIYAYLGENEKCEKLIHRICNECFSATPQGYPGDEDNGSMSAWYVLSCLGMYRLTPGKDEWVKIKPLVRHAKILGKQIFK